MRKIEIAIIAMVAAACSHVPPATQQVDGADLLWYDREAQQWEETLPLGNGRLGMMPDGGVRKEKIVLNDISMWSGSVADYSNPEAAKSLPEIQRLLKEGKNKEAQDVMYEHFVPSKPEKGGTYGSYQMLAELNVEYYYTGDGEAEGYRRWLNLQDAVIGTEYAVDGVEYEREYFVPRGKDVMVARIRANKPGAVNLEYTLTRPERGAATSPADGVLMLTGSLDSGAEGKEGVRYAAVAQAVAHGAGCKVATVDSMKVRIANADEAWIVVAANTDYLSGELYLSKTLREASEAAKADIEAWRAEGIAAHRALYDRAHLYIPPTANSELPTDKRIESFQTEADPQLAALYYNYGRYLLISSTLPGALPPNLQGLWANECGTPWNGDYHTNINVQMNHWPAEPGNLSELHEPLIELVKRAVPSGERTARAFYGPNAKGWVMHMMTNPWGYTEPGEHPSWGATNTGGAWLCAHLWEHYLYNPTDTVYLQEIYPVMKGASEFFLSTMIREPKNGYLVTAPSSSPENQFYSEDGTPTSVCMGPTMDNQLVRELFGNVISASEALGLDDAYADSLRAAVAELPPHQVGSDGRLMEWLEEYPETDRQHRHVSHLYGLHPGNQISVANTPELAEAARKTLEARGDGGTGWSRAWKINFWARLGDGNHAYKMLQALLEPAYTAERPQHGAGTFPNLFCSHPPFQMDGNWGGAAGIGEMLVQSQDGFINVLPALPDAMPEGSLRGFKVRGGATVDVDWRNGKVTRIAVKGDGAKGQKVRTPDGIIELDGPRVITIDK